jgi:hypothetical protein
MLYRRDGIVQVMSGALFPPDVMLGIQVKEFKLGLIRPENLLSHGLHLLGAFWQTSSGLSCVFY